MLSAFSLGCFLKMVKIFILILMLGGIKIIDMERLYTSQLANNLSTHKRALKVNDMHARRSIYLRLTEF